VSDTANLFFAEFAKFKMMNDNTINRADLSDVMCLNLTQNSKCLVNRSSRELKDFQWNNRMEVSRDISIMCL